MLSKYFGNFPADRIIPNMGLDKKQIQNIAGLFDKAEKGCASHLFFFMGKRNTFFQEIGHKIMTT